MISSGSSFPGRNQISVSSSFLLIIRYNSSLVAKSRRVIQDHPGRAVAESESQAIREPFAGYRDYLFFFQASSGFHPEIMPGGQPDHLSNSARFREDCLTEEMLQRKCDSEKGGK